MSDSPEIKDIIAELQRLQIQQSGLLQRLEQLSGGDNDSSTETRVPNTTRAFTVGDRVRIANPGWNQANCGKIIKIGKSRITVEARNGTKIIRDPKNLLHDYL
jgi:hypothetical protein